MAVAVLEIAIGCGFVAIGVRGGQFYGGGPGASERRKHPLSGLEGRILFVVGGLVSILVGLEKITHR